MRLISTATESVEPITHDQKLQRIPGRLKRLKAIRIIDFFRKVSDDPLDDVIGSRHPRVKAMSSGIRNLLQEGEKFSFQSTGSPCLSVALEEVHLLTPLLHIWGIEISWAISRNFSTPLPLPLYL
jgi:hypothetical protein